MNMNFYEYIIRMFNKYIFIQKTPEEIKLDDILKKDPTRIIGDLTKFSPEQLEKITKYDINANKFYKLTKLVEEYSCDYGTYV